MTRPTLPANPQVPSVPSVPSLLLRILWQPILVFLACAAFFYILVFAPSTYSGVVLLAWTAALTSVIVFSYIFWRLLLAAHRHSGD